MSDSHPTSHHRHHHPIKGEQQLALTIDAQNYQAPAHTTDADRAGNDWAVDAGTRRLGLAAIHRARHLLDAAALHDAEAAARRSDELRRPLPTQTLRRM